MRSKSLLSLTSIVSSETKRTQIKHWLASRRKPTPPPPPPSELQMIHWTDKTTSSQRQGSRAMRIVRLAFPAGLAGTTVTPHYGMGYSALSLPFRRLLVGGAPPVTDERGQVARSAQLPPRCPAIPSISLLVGDRQEMMDSQFETSRHGAKQVRSFANLN